MKRPVFRRPQQLLIGLTVLATAALGSVPAVAYASPAAKFHAAKLNRGAPVPGRSWTPPAPATGPALASAPVPAAHPLPIGPYVASFTASPVVLNPLSRQAVHRQVTDTPVGNPVTWSALGSSGLLVGVRLPTAATAVLKVAVQVYSPAAAGAAGGVLALRVGQSGGPARSLQLRVPDAALQGLYGADFAARVGWTIPPQRAGGAATKLAAQHDPSGRSTTVSIPPATSPQLMMAAASSTVASNGAGNFGASPLKPSSSWQVSAQTGSFSWSYPLPVPPTGAGPAPSLALAYDSGSIDGETGSTNNQPSAIGEGWNVTGGGFIERSYVPCATDGASATPPTNQPNSGDECWKTDNATLSLGGRSGSIVKGASGWKLQNDDGTTITKLTGATNGDGGTAGVDGTGENWLLTTTDGTKYYFGETTNSAWTVPVFGNDAGEPCHAGTFAASACQQAWRWNLDKVVDPHGNAETFNYTVENNRYLQNGTTTVTYTRGGQLKEIDYGLRDGASTAAPQRVIFDLVSRCTVAGCTAAQTSYWPDTPWYEDCLSKACTSSQNSPTFWSQYMVSAIHTQLVTGGVGTNINTWTLTHTFPDPGDPSTVKSSPVLVLTQLVRSSTIGGHTVTLPALRFTNQTRQNRVYPANYSLSALDKFRIITITTETGATIAVNYSAQDCTPTSLPADPSTNTRRCFPQWWTPPSTGVAQLDYFHKYVVTSIVQSPVTGGPSLADTTSYDYTGTPGWRYDNSPLVPDNQRTWSIYAGYDTVTVRHGDPNAPSQQLTISYLFYRGMDGDHGRTGVDITGTLVPDSLWFAGRVYQQTVTNGSGGAVVSTTTTTPWASAPTATDGTLSAYLTGDADAVTITPTSSGNRTTETVTSHDSSGRVTSLSNLADTSTSADDQCTTTSYVTSTTGWQKFLPTEIKTVGRACGQTASLPADAISDTAYTYDHLSDPNQPPTLGELTSTAVVNSYSGSSPHWQTTINNNYDTLGRLTSTSDPRTSPARTTATAYTPTGAGPVTQTIATNTYNWQTTTTVDPATGAPSTILDPNGHRTDVTYDGMGRVSQLWLPQRPKSTNPNSPSSSYTYTIPVDGSGNVNGPISVASTLINNFGGTTTSYALYDGLLRPVQTQAPAEGGGRIVTNTFYDGASQVTGANNPYYDTANPSGGTVFLPTLTVPSATQTVYDGAGRTTASLLLANNHEKWRTTYSYGGDSFTTTPPTGGTTTTAWNDARGNTVRLQQWHTSTATGASDSTYYTFDHANRPASMTDNASKQWNWTYDVLGRQVSAADPDKGTTTTSSYDTAGRLATTTDARGVKLAYSYDLLDRKTGEYLNAADSTGTPLAAWSYDPVFGTATNRGQAGSSTRYVGSSAGVAGTAYTEAVTGYDAAYRPTGQSITLPSGTPLAGSYPTALYYTPGGGLSDQVDPALGGQVSEDISFGYDSLGNLSGLGSSTGNYLGGVSYDHLNNLGQTTQSQNAAEVIRTYTRDPATLRLTELLTQRVASSNAVVSDRSYSYSNAGTIGSVTDATPVNGTDTQCASYDYAQRLTAAWTPATGGCTTPSGTNLGGPAPYWQAYSYDQAGDRATITRNPVGTGTPSTDSYAYTAPGSAHAVSSITHTGASTGTDNYGHDAAGNTTSRPGQTLSYDSEGHLATVTTAGSTQSNVYDADGNLLTSTDSSGTTAYLGDTEVHLATAGAVTSTRTYTAPGLGAVAERAATATSNQLYFLDPDSVGTVDAVVNTITNTPTYRYSDPFGAPRGTPASNWPDQHGYLNKPLNPSTGLTHLGARDYDPVLGAFLTVDPILDPQNPQQNNGYSYAWNNPLDKADPSGLEPRLPGHCFSNDPTCNSTYGGSEASPGNTTGDACTDYACRTHNDGNDGTAPPPPGQGSSTACRGLRCHTSMSNPTSYHQVCDPTHCELLPSNLGHIPGEESLYNNPKQWWCTEMTTCDPIAVGGFLFIWSTLIGAPETAIEALPGRAFAADTAGDAAGSSDQYVYRVHGGDSGPMGHSWTPENPMGMANPRNELGLPKVNSGQLLTRARVLNMDGVTARDALPLDGTDGGAPEWLFPDPASQLEPHWTIPLVPSW